MLPIVTRVDKNSPLPRYHQVRHILLNMVTSAAWKPGDKIPSELDIAETMGVSKMTVNKALVALTAEGYFYREVGRGTFVAGAKPLSTDQAVVKTFFKQEPRRVYLVADGPAEYIPDNEYFCSLALAARCHVSPLHVRLISLQSEGPDYLAQYRSHEEAAMMIVAPDETCLGGLRDLAEINANVVVLGASWKNINLSYADSDNVQGAKLAVDHLVSLGHRDIAMFYGRLGTSNTYDRIDGFREAMHSHGLNVREDWMVGTDQFYTSEEMMKLLQHWVRSKSAPTAIFAAGAFIARAVLEFMQDQGISVPEQLSIISFDDPSATANVTPLLTTIVQPLERMAQVAMDHIEALRTNSSPMSDLQTLLPCHLKVRGSTSPY